MKKNFSDLIGILTKSKKSDLLDKVLNEEKRGFIDGKLLQKAIDTWGVDAQIEMIEEECLELALAIQKFPRSRGDKTKKYNNIIDEIADVKIMIEQAQRIFSKDLINKRVDFKMNRLKDRLSEGVC